MNKNVTTVDSMSPTKGERKSLQATWRDYVHVTKPRIVRTNLVASFGGFWVASGWSINWWLLLFMLLGNGLVMASACVFNNWLDRDLDTMMDRTKDRPLAQNKISPRTVFIYGVILGIVGLSILYFINAITALLGIVGWLVYVFVYTLWLKRTSTWSTSIGGISGAMPPMIGYCAVSNELDAGAWILFGILFLWQPPHFWALGILRRDDYKNAGFPLLPVVKGITRTKYQMIPYVIALIPVSILFYTYGYVGMVYLITAIILGILWLIISLYGLKAKNTEKWARFNFIYSLNYLTILFVVMIFNTTNVNG
ncbi:heme o synthase [Longirhabdus pacifica]|uniref:heme o synthase n=1 Tax=Longirhabdus pacifica TaxID=2305227 RepID=UPI001F0C22E2|nr:heme o synthase [Longirhabdus pacifica]